MSDVEIRTVGYFLTVVETGSLTAAAKRLDLTQPALTKAIRRLEDEVGSALFLREARGVVLTAFGQTFLRHARTVRSAMADATNELQALREGRAGVVRIGAGEIWLIDIVPRAVHLFRRDFPNVRLHIHGGVDGTLRDALRETPLDMVLTAIPEGVDEPDLTCTPLLIDEYQVVADRRHPLRRKTHVQLKDLLDYPWILPAPTAYLSRRLNTIFRAAGLSPPDPIIETAELTRFKLTLLNGPAGSNYLSFHEVRDLEAMALKGIAPLPVDGASWQRKAGIVTRAGLVPNPPALEFAKIVCDLCQAERGRYQENETTVG
ncbi:MAG: LysR family transcriptional regulator [Alphaproteobacteria bacterium]